VHPFPLRSPSHCLVCADRYLRRYGLSTCACNLSMAVAQYIVGRVSKLQEGDRWPYSYSWYGITAVMFIGTLLAIALYVVTPDKVPEARERSNSFTTVRPSLPDPACPLFSIGVVMTTCRAYS
jgi:hypothetical protein